MLIWLKNFENILTFCASFPYINFLKIFSKNLRKKFLLERRVFTPTLTEILSTPLNYTSIKLLLIDF